MRNLTGWRFMGHSADGKVERLVFFPSSYFYFVEGWFAVDGQILDVSYTWHRKNACLSLMAVHISKEYQNQKNMDIETC